MIVNFKSIWFWCFSFEQLCSLVKDWGPLDESAVCIIGAQHSDTSKTINLDDVWLTVLKGIPFLPVPMMRYFHIPLTILLFPR